MIRKSSVAVLTGILFAASLVGCSLMREDLVGAGRIQIEPAPAGSAALAKPIVWDGHDKLVVMGWMEHDGSHHYNRGHVHVIVRSPNGEELGRQQVRLQKRDAGARTIRQHRSTYTATFAHVPPVGSKVQVWHCHDKHENAANQTPPDTRQGT